MNTKLTAIGKAGNDVQDLTPHSVALLSIVAKHFDCDGSVFLYETIHGHIAFLNRREGTFFTKDAHLPMRLGLETANFIQTLKGFRWIEPSNGSVRIGFTNIGSCA